MKENEESKQTSASDLKANSAPPPPGGITQSPLDYLKTVIEAKAEGVGSPDNIKDQTTRRDSRPMQEIIRDTEKIMAGERKPWVEPGTSPGPFPAGPEQSASRVSRELPSQMPDYMRHNLTFSIALIHIMGGKKVRRRPWWAHDFVVMMPALNLPPYNTQGTERKVNDRTAKHIGEWTPLNSQPYLAHFRQDGTLWQPGWIPSQDDLFANDWSIIE